MSKLTFNSLELEGLQLVLRFLYINNRPELTPDMLAVIAMNQTSF